MTLGGDWTIGYTGQTLAYANNITFSSSTFLHDWAGSDITLTGQLSGAATPIYLNFDGGNSTPTATFHLAGASANAFTGASSLVALGTVALDTVGQLSGFTGIQVSRSNFGGTLNWNVAETIPGTTIFINRSAIGGGGNINTFATLGMLTTGTTTINGQYKLNNGAGTDGADLWLNTVSGGTLALAGQVTDALSVNARSLTKIGAGTAVLSAITNDYRGVTTVLNGTLLVNNASGSGTGTGAVAVSGVGSTASTFTTTLASQTLTVGSTSGLVLGQSVTGTGIQSGSYIVSIINGTSFNLNKTATAAGATSLSFGATAGILGGTGFMAPTGTAGITVASGGFIAPGSAGIGTLTVDLSGTTGTVSVASGAAFKFELGTANASIGTIAAGSSDRLSLTGASTGDFAFTGNNVDFLGTGAAGYYKLFSTSLGSATTWTGLTSDPTTGVVSVGLSYSGLAGGLTGGQFIVGTASNGGALGDIYFVTTAIPEPATSALLSGAGILTAVAFSRRRRQG